MTFERKDVVQDISTTAGTGAFTPSGAAPSQFVPISAHTIGATFRYKAFTGTQWEIGTGTWNGTTVARSVRKSSNGDALVNFTTPPTILEVVDATDVAAFLTAADGIDVTTLPTTGSVGDADSVLVIQGGTLKLTTVAVMKAYYGGGTGTTVVAPGQVTGLTAGTATDTTQVLNWSAPSTGTAPFTYKVEKSAAGANSWTVLAAAVSASPYTATGLTASTSYDYRVSATNTAGTGAVSATLTTSTTAAPVSVPGQVTGLAAGTSTSTTQDLTWTAVSGATSYKVEKSPTGANTWATAAATASGTSYTVTGLTASTSYDYRVSGNNTAGTGTPSATVTKSTTAAPVQTITVNTPSTQTVGVSYPASGTYANGTPTALDFSVDGGTTWSPAPSPTIGGGNWSFTATPSTASAARQMMVRDHTTLVSGTSGTYVVNAAAAVVYTATLVTGANPGFPTAQSMGWTSGEAAVSSGVIIVAIKGSDNSVPDSTTMKWVLGKSATTAPMAYADGAPAIGTNGNTAAHGNAVATAINKVPGWATSADPTYGQFKNGSQFYAWGTPSSVAPVGGWYVWVLLPDGTKKVVVDGSGNPVQWVLS